MFNSVFTKLKEDVYRNRIAEGMITKSLINGKLRPFCLFIINSISFRHEVGKAHTCAMRASINVNRAISVSRARAHLRDFYFISLIYQPRRLIFHAAVWEMIPFESSVSVRCNRTYTRDRERANEALFFSASCRSALCMNRSRHNLRRESDSYLRVFVRARISQIVF